VYSKICFAKYNLVSYNFFKSPIVNRSTELTTKSKIVNSHSGTLPTRLGEDIEQE